MEGGDKRRSKWIKGMPSAVALSLLIHVALFLLAGMLVVFTVVKKEEKKFTPPKAVERPKMKLKKPKVKVKKTAKPKPTPRIVTKMNRASMPDIQLPEMSGMGEGLGGGIGGFDMMPDFKTEGLFGGGQSIGNDFVGTFYDLKRDRRGRNIPMDPTMQQQVLNKFIGGGWKTSILARYYRSPKKLYATSFMIPTSLSSFVPSQFGEAETPGYLWMVHYKGQLVHKEDITFRFFGSADEYMVVRVDGSEVLTAAHSVHVPIITPHWQSSTGDSRKYKVGGAAVAGDWITLAAGVPLDMEIVIAEGPGGGFCAMLVVEVEGVEYERNKLGDPIMPMFKTAEPSADLLDAIVEHLIPGEANPTNGPVFSDYATPSRTPTREEGLLEPLAKDFLLDHANDHKSRTWILEDGKTLEARFVVVMGDKVVLKDVRGKQRKIPLARLSAGDRTFIELARPPKFNIDFSKKSSQVVVKVDTPFWTATQSGFSRADFDYVFTAKLEQTSAGLYNHELKVEFFAIGEEVEGDNYILLDRQKSRFTPTKENGRSHAFHGNAVRLTKYDLWEARGKKYGGYLVVVTDSRGEIIDYGSSHKWLLGILGNLRQLPIGKHMDKTGVRVFPPSPKIMY